MLNYKHLSFIFFFVIGVNEGFSQFRFSNEIGIVAGPVAFQSDFGERQDFETNSGNTGFGVGIVHYMNFTYLKRYNSRSRSSFFNQHFKVRNESLFLILQSLNHFGKWVDEARQERECRTIEKTFW